jgi:hypothetical protein
LEERTTGVGIDKNDEVFTLMNYLKISNIASRINFTFGRLFQSKSKHMILIVIIIVSVITIIVVLLKMGIMYFWIFEHGKKFYYFSIYSHLL